jgi:hypothetical protein
VERDHRLLVFKVYDFDKHLWSRIQISTKVRDSVKTPIVYDPVPRVFLGLLDIYHRGLKPVMKV